MLLSMTLSVSSFFIFSTCFSLCVWNVVSLEFVRRYLSISPLMIPRRPVPGGWADEACRLSFVSVHTKNIYVSLPICGGGVCFRKDSGFQCTHENVSVGRCRLCTHGCALFLNVTNSFVSFM